jgi:small ligand-binding sensory domain FIST
MKSNAAIEEGGSWANALAAIGLDEAAAAPAPDLALFFANPEYPDLDSLVAEAYRRTAASVLIGCSGQGIIGPDREIEGEPALSLLNLNLPGTDLHPRHIEMDDLEPLRTPADWHAWLGITPDQVNAWILLVDPYTFDPDALVGGLSAAYPDAAMLGGLASGLDRTQGTAVFMNGEVHHSGAVVLAVGGAYTVQAVVAQGATPIGEPWTITGVERNVLRTIGNRPALDVLRETLNGLTGEMRERAARNLLVGLAMDEYRDSFQQGDFLIRNLMGVDPATGAVAIGAMPDVGQTIQFQIRDAQAADQDLKRQLSLAGERLGGTEVAGALLCTCNGRGVGLFGTADHDARTVSGALGPIPLAGFFCNGEIGPVGARTYLHGFTASLALFVPRKP